METSSIGAMAESSGKVPKASTYISSVGVDVTSTQVDSTTIALYCKASTLPNVEHGKCPRMFPHGGDGGKFNEGSESKHILPVDEVEDKYMPRHTHTQVSKSRWKVPGSSPHRGDGGTFEEGSGSRHLQKRQYSRICCSWS